MKKRVSLCGGCKHKEHPCRCFVCLNHHETVYYCDKCGHPIKDDVYCVNKKDYCEACLKDTYRKDAKR